MKLNIVTVPPTTTVLSDPSSSSSFTGITAHSIELPKKFKHILEKSTGRRIVHKKNLESHKEKALKKIKEYMTSQNNNGDEKITNCLEMLNNKSEYTATLAKDRYNSYSLNIITTKFTTPANTGNEYMSQPF